MPKISSAKTNSSNPVEKLDDCYFACDNVQLSIVWPLWRLFVWQFLRKASIVILSHTIVVSVANAKNLTWFQLFYSFCCSPDFSVDPDIFGDFFFLQQIFLYWHVDLLLCPFWFSFKHDLILALFFKALTFFFKEYSPYCVLSTVSVPEVYMLKYLLLIR